ncbi:38.7k [Erannis ankeraria nucleopolyhedrovirus]|uniref:38.7k n=1 Tax=Erannis ankeraria nucleopolyhedrovirus TaxID=2913600 RepID=UPI002481FAD5|nr:38.7k [Erannis ankeraria nucleopolyhedrovirus]UJZ89079.1 38.7k [Erannis ankeraria nucleopolyhedrovirus]
MEFLNRIFNSLFGQSADEECNKEKEKHNVKMDFRKNASSQNYSYLLEKQTFKFHNQFLFALRYTVTEELWMVGCDFAYGIGFDDAEKAIKSLVDDRYVKSLNTIVFKNNVAQDSNQAGNVKCINKTGAFQLLNNINFENKAEFIAYLSENFKNLESKLTTNKSSSVCIDEKLSKVLTAIETIKKDNVSLLDHNELFKNQVFNKFGAFEKRFNEQIVELDKKICLYDNVEQLYNKLRTFHKSKEITGSFSNLSFLSDTAHNNDDYKYETVKFPRDSSKYPRLAVYVKSNEQGTDLAFLAGQQKNMRARKRKYQDMELVYDAVHPNPLLALHCIDEELENKNFKYCKKSKRVYCIDSDIDTVKSFINENV